MGLLLAQVMRYQPLMPVVEPADLSRVLLLVLGSPLAQNRDARDRLRAATSIDHGVAASISSSSNTIETENEAVALFGLPQLAWPCNAGWLDGLFELVHSYATHPVRCLSYINAFISTFFPLSFTVSLVSTYYIREFPK